MSTVAVCRKLHVIVLLLVTLLLLFGHVALQLQATLERLAADVTNRSNDDHATHNNMTSAPSNESALEGYQPGQCLSLQHLTHGAFVQCRKSQQSECLTEDNFWEKKCYINMTKSVIFYHLGKGGGGTIFSSLEESGIIIKRDHPRPKHDLGQFRNGVKVLINVRDPVDRFVSAFNWRSLLFCQRDGEHRGRFPTEIERKHKGQARYQPYSHPQEFCYDESVVPVEANIIQNIYNDDINMLAEALCEESSSYNQAVEYSKRIGHARLSLSGWLEYFVSTNATSTKPSQGLTNFMAITFEERTSSLLEHTREAIQMLYYDHGVDENTVKRLLENKPARTKLAIERASHSSRNNNPRRKVPRAIGECCLARFLEDDYQIIQYIVGGNTSEAIGSLGHIDPVIGTACDWGSPTRRQLCRADLQSMLKRRSGFLDRSLGSCHDIVSRMNHSKV